MVRFEYKIGAEFPYRVVVPSGFDDYENIYFFTEEELEELYELLKKYFND